MGLNIQLYAWIVGTTTATARTLIIQELESIPDSMKMIPQKVGPLALREYQPLWEKVKSTVYKDCEVTSFKGEVKISAAPKYHRRIFKAVMKEKYQDADFRFHCTRLGLPFRLDTRVNPAIPHLLIITIKTGNAL